MAIATKAMRIFEADHGPIRLLASMEGRQPADVVHAALQEYLQKHGDRLADVYAQTQAMIQAGDLNGLTRALAADAADDAQAMKDELADIRANRR